MSQVISVECPKCKTVLEGSPEDFAGLNGCPECGAGISVPSGDGQSDGTPPKCPGCSNDMPTDAVICVFCGLNVKTGRKIQGVAAGPALPCSPREALKSPACRRNGMAVFLSLAPRVLKWGMPVAVFGGIVLAAAWLNDTVTLGYFQTKASAILLLDSVLEEPVPLSYGTRLKRAAATNDLSLTDDDISINEMKIDLKGDDMNMQGYRCALLTTEARIRKRRLGLIPVTQKAYFSHRVLVPNYYAFSSCQGARPVWQNLTSACFEFPAEGGTVVFGGMQLNVPAGAVPAGTQLVIRYPYEAPGAKVPGQLLHCVRLETRPACNFALPVTLHLTTSKLQVNARAIKRESLADEKVEETRKLIGHEATPTLQITSRVMNRASLTDEKVTVTRKLIGGEGTLMVKTETDFMFYRVRYVGPTSFDNQSLSFGLGPKEEAAIADPKNWKAEKVYVGECKDVLVFSQENSQGKVESRRVDFRPVNTYPPVVVPLTTSEGGSSAAPQRGTIRVRFVFNKEIPEAGIKISTDSPALDLYSWPNIREITTLSWEVREGGVYTVSIEQPKP